MTGSIRNMTTHVTGDQCEILVALEAMKRGYKVSFPFGHDTRYDLIMDRNNRLERVQVKQGKSDGDVLKAYVRSGGKCKGANAIKKYTAAEIDCIIMVDIDTGKCYYLPIALVGGRDGIALRMKPTKNNQQKRINYAIDFESW